MSRYRFDDFILSPRRRVLLRSGRALPLIPRYFDLLVYLVERRGEAVHRRDIFDAVWTDVAVSDSALSQAVRTIRRVLGDDPREPRFLRTVSRHGYQFVFDAVVEEEDNGNWPAQADAPDRPAADAPLAPVDVSGTVDTFEPLLDRIVARAATSAEEEDQREAAEQLHGLGTAEALRRLDGRPGAAYARALLRDTRWDTPDAGAVPVLGAPHPGAVARELVRLRLRRTFGIVAARWAGASAGGGVAGAVAGCGGGVLLVLSPGSTAPFEAVPVLGVIGAGCGACAGAGIGAGLAIAESAARSARTAALTAGGAVGGAATGLLIQFLARSSLEVLVGRAASIGGGIEGLAVGAAAGLAYGATTRRAGGPATPRGRGRFVVAAATATGCALAALALTLSGRVLVGGTVHAVAQASAGIDGNPLLAPLGHLVGEPGFGPVTSALIAMCEGVAFGLGLAVGLTHRR